MMIVRRKTLLKIKLKGFEMKRLMKMMFQEKLSLSFSLRATHFTWQTTLADDYSGKKRHRLLIIHLFLNLFHIL